MIDSDQRGHRLPKVFIGLFPDRGVLSIPGLGREILVAVKPSDYPAIQAVTVYLAALTMVINLITDDVQVC